MPDPVSSSAEISPDRSSNPAATPDDGRGQAVGTSKAYRRYLRPSFVRYWHLIALTIVLSLVGALFEGVSVALLIPFLQSMEEGGGPGFMTNIGWIDSFVLGVDLEPVKRLTRVSLIIISVTWVRFILSYLGLIAGISARTRIVADMRTRAIDQLQAVALSYYSGTRTGDVLNTVTNELTRVGAALAVVVETIGASSLLLVYIVFMMLVSWHLTLGTLAFLAVLSIGLSVLVASIRRHGYRNVDAYSGFSSRLTEFLSGIKTIRASGTERFERRRLVEQVQFIAHSVRATVKRSAMVQPISTAVVTTALVVIVVIAVRLLVIPGKLDVALLLAFLFALLRMMPKVHVINAQRGKWAQVTGAMARVGGLLREDDKPFLPDGDQEAAELLQGMTFENVDFSYVDGEPVLAAISIAIPTGKTTALVGASGAGKTTLADLIPRFYDATAGRVLWDGIDVREFTVASLRRRIAVVSQDTFVFNDTIAANIAYGSGEVPREDIRNAAARADALTFIDQMPEGMDTVLGDRGVRLSGGQRQRIAIARALLRDPDILILDEATSALDSISEKAVQDSLETLMQGRTVVAIAHRLSTIENADNIVVLEDGRVVEQGTFSELTARRGQFWEYYSIQFQKSEAETGLE